MAQRYVRVQTPQGQILYGLLRLNREVEVIDAPAWLGGQPTGDILAPDGYQLLAPCAPSKIIAVGHNYAAHAAELGQTVPPEPLLFLKPPSAIVAHHQGIMYPPQCQQLEFEGELALVIGDRTHHCPEEEAYQKIWGYTIANDVTARDLQRQDDQWTRAKGFDTFCPLGPWIVREISPDAQLRTYVNYHKTDGQETAPAQAASVQEMIFSVTQLVSYISHIMTLLPGDIILTGTPAGVQPVQIGDRLLIAIEGIGELENPIIAP
ncbi:fumarylacetoacetate hydrolase family protein [Synechococcus moorigangaii CMS01]|nr:fumarylacetoacetate hydrolase family protein [Synechococcus moorigangaii CMS01]